MVGLWLKDILVYKYSCIFFLGVPFLLCHLRLIQTDLLWNRDPDQYYAKVFRLTVGMGPGTGHTAITIQCHRERWRNGLVSHWSHSYSHYSVKTSAKYTWNHFSRHRYHLSCVWINHNINHRTKILIQGNPHSLCEPHVHFRESRNQYLYDIIIHIVVPYILVKMVEGKTKDHIGRKIVQIQELWYFGVIHTRCYRSCQHSVHLKSFLKFRHQFTNLAAQKETRASVQIQELLQESNDNEYIIIDIFCFFLIFNWQDLIF